MTKNNRARTRPPQPSAQPNQDAPGDKVDRVAADSPGTGDNAGEIGVSGMIGERASARIAELPTSRRQPRTIFEAAALSVSAKVAEKVQIMGDVRQKLAEAADLFRQGDDEAKKATEIAAAAAFRLYTARVNGMLSADEVTAALGDTFGYKVKKDGKPSKTPLGQGEAIRKRVVRAVSAAEYVTNGDGGRFFEGLPEKEVADIVNLVEAGDYSVYRAYDRLAEIKRENAVRTNIAFDPKRIAGIVESLSEEGVADILRSNPALVAAYGALVDILTVVGAEAMDAAEEAAEAA